MQLFSHCFVIGTLFVSCITHTLASSKSGDREMAIKLLEQSQDFINKAKDLYPDCEAECKKYVERPMDCSDILRSGQNESGIYTIWPRTANKSLTVYCDMETDGGGWTVIQRRGQFSTPKDYFGKDWLSYKNGFGHLSEEFWIGNDNIYAITHQAKYKIRFDLRDVNNKTGFAEYNTFWVDDEANHYTLHIRGYKGNVGDSMSGDDQMVFRTYYRTCTLGTEGGWWYNNGCTSANLNGFNQPGVEDSYKSFHWYEWRKNNKGLSGVEMKLR